MHPRAGVAEAQGTLAAGIHAGIEVEGILVGGGGGGQGEPGARAAGHEGGHTGHGVFGMGICTGFGARHVEGKRAHAAHGGHHAAGVKTGYVFNIRIRLGRAIAVRYAFGDGDGVKLPVAGNGIIAKGQPRNEHKKTQGEDAQDGFHEGDLLSSAQGGCAHFPQENDYILFIA